LQSPDWSNVANPSRCQFCHSEYHLSSDELYPEPASLELALTRLRLNNPSKHHQGQDNVSVGSGLRIQDQVDSIRWWTVGEGCWWTDQSVDSPSVRSPPISDDSSGKLTSENGGCGSSFFSLSSLELSHLEESGSRRAADFLSEDWNDDDRTECHDTEPVDRERSDRSSRQSGGRQRSDWSPTDRDWVVRRRSDGSRYIGRRRDRHRRSMDPARRSPPRSTSHQSPGSYDHQRGLERATEDVIHATDRWPDADRDNYNAVEWICSPHCTDSSYRIVAVI